MSQIMRSRAAHQGAGGQRTGRKPVNRVRAAAPVTWLTPAFAIAPQIGTGDVVALAKAGFRAIIAVRPDGEDAAAPASREIARAAATHDLAFRYAPVASHALTEAETIEQFEMAVADVQGPVLAYCKSGMRAAIVWALAAARYQPAACVGEALRKAGVDPDLVEDDLHSQRRKAGARPGPLTVECAAASAA